MSDRYYAELDVMQECFAILNGKTRLKAKHKHMSAILRMFEGYLSDITKSYEYKEIRNEDVVRLMRALVEISKIQHRYYQKGETKCE